MYLLRSRASVSEMISSLFFPAPPVAGLFLGKSAKRGVPRQRARHKFSEFTADNDPHSEHDFGSFELVGRKFFWKIDYYDKRCEFGSDDPADPEKTTRVLTVMLAGEY